MNRQIEHPANLFFSTTDILQHVDAYNLKTKTARVKLNYSKKAKLTFEGAFNVSASLYLSPVIDRVPQADI